MSPNTHTPVALRNIEFRNLYEEITYHSEKIQSIIRLSILSTGAFHGAVLSLIFVKDGIDHDAGAKDIVPWFFLLPLLFILPSIILVAAHLNAIVRVGSYIQVFFEEHLPNEGIGWQKNIQELRAVEQDKNVQEAGGVRLFRTAISMVLPGLAVFCIGPSILSTLFYNVGSPVDIIMRYVYYASVIMLVGMTVWLTGTCYRAWSTENFKKKVALWKDLKKKPQKMK